MRDGFLKKFMPSLEVKVELETCTQIDVLIWVLGGTHRLVKVVQYIYIHTNNKAHLFGFYKVHLLSNIWRYD